VNARAWGFEFVMVAAIALLAWMITRYIKRQEESQINTIRKQASCPHPYTYFDSGEKTCARCGKKVKGFPRIS
jgi:hypothetical protein